MKIGVIIVSYDSNDVIIECLQSLLASDFDDLPIVVCDNASPDNSNDLIRNFAEAEGIDTVEIQPADLDGKPQKTPGRLTLIRSPENRGYAGAVNMGLDYFMACDGVDNYWVLNPDCVVQENTASSYAREIARNPGFGLMSGRTLYHGEDGMIQSDGGTVNLWTGICSNVNFSRNKNDVELPHGDELDYLSGANLIASRGFVDVVGKMTEDYFLYYEEVDWAMRRGDFPLVNCPEAVIYHHGGTSIGSGTTKRRHSSFANYFNFRNRSWFVKRFRPWAVPVAYGYSILKIAKLLLVGATDEANGAFRGLHNMRPPASVSDRINTGAHKYAFARRG